MGSANRAPYCSVKFAYTNRNHDVNLNYIAGSEFEETKLLSEIGIYYGAELYRRYTMTYNYDGNDFTYLLSKITVTGQNNETLKPIVFNWYKNTDFKHKQVVYDQSSNAMNYINKAYISLGDYNGDGRTDLLATPMEDANWTGWRLFWRILMEISSLIRGVELFLKDIRSRFPVITMEMVLQISWRAGRL